MRCPSVGCGNGEPKAISNAVGNAKFRSRSHDTVICVYDEAGNVIETVGFRGFNHDVIMIAQQHPGMDAPTGMNSKPRLSISAH